MRRYAFFLGCALLLLPALPASALTLTFSALSSDETDPALLDAVLDVQVAGTTLTLTLTNQSTYNLAELYFNAKSNVTGLTLTSAVHSDGNTDVTASWPLVLAGPPGNPTQPGGFGKFDFLLDGPEGQDDPALIGPGESIVFTLAISGTGPFTASDFVELTSDGEFPSFAAVKFVNGPDDDSAFGNAVPEPGTASLLVAGLAALAASRRPRKRGPRKRGRS